LLEIISPAGFDHYFEEMIASSGGADPTPRSRHRSASVTALEIDMSSVAALTAEHNIKFG
jgi:hypothetical protein